MAVTLLLLSAISEYVIFNHSRKFLCLCRNINSKNAFMPSRIPLQGTIFYDSFEVFFEIFLFNHKSIEASVFNIEPKYYRTHL